MERVKRQYRAPRRERQAQETRRAIMASALELFLSQGFAQTSVRRVAEGADVSEQTVYAAFGDKVGLLYEAARAYVASAGGQEEAEFLAALRAEPDALRRIALVARNSRETWEGSAAELEVLVTNPATRDPRLTEIAEMSLAHRLASARAVCEVLFPDDIRRPGLSVDDIATFAAAVDSGAVVSTLRSLGWDLDHWEAWVTRLLALFLNDAGSSG